MKSNEDFKDVDITISDRIMGEQHEDWSEQCQSCSGKGCDECNQTGEIVYTINMDAKNRLIGEAHKGKSQIEEEDDYIVNNILYLIKSTRKVVNNSLNGFVTNEEEKDIYKSILISNFERVNLESNQITPNELLEMCLPDNLSIPLLKNPAFCNIIESLIDETFVKQKLIFSLVGELSKSEEAIECYKVAVDHFFQNSNI